MSMSAETATERERAEAGAVPELRRALAAPDAAPGPLPLRVLSAPLRAGLAVPQLRRTPDDRPDEHHRGHDLPDLRRLDAEARMSGATWLSEWQVARRAAGGAVDPLGRLLRSSASQVDEVMEAGARVIHCRRDGRAFRPADHDRAAGRRLDRRPGPRGRRRGRRPPDDRGARAPDRGLRRGRRRLDHLPRGGDPARQPHPGRDPRARLPGRGRDQPRHAGRGARRAARPRRHRPLHDGQPRLGRPVLHRGLARQGRPPRRRWSATPRSRSTAASTPPPPARSPTPAPPCSSPARPSSAPTIRQPYARSPRRRCAEARTRAEAKQSRTQGA